MYLRYGYFSLVSFPRKWAKCSTVHILGLCPVSQTTKIWPFIFGKSMYHQPLDSVYDMDQDRKRHWHHLFPVSKPVFASSLWRTQQGRALKLLLKTTQSILLHVYIYMDMYITFSIHLFPLPLNLWLYIDLQVIHFRFALFYLGVLNIEKLFFPHKTFLLLG